ASFLPLRLGVEGVTLGGLLLDEERLDRGLLVGRFLLERGDVEGGALRLLGGGAPGGLGGGDRGESVRAGGHGLGLRLRRALDGLDLARERLARVVDGGARARLELLRGGEGVARAGDGLGLERDGGGGLARGGARGVEVAPGLLARLRGGLEGGEGALLFVGALGESLGRLGRRRSRGLHRRGALGLAHGRRRLARGLGRLGGDLRRLVRGLARRRELAVRNLERALGRLRGGVERLRVLGGLLGGARRRGEGF